MPDGEILVGLRRGEFCTQTLEHPPPLLWVLEQGLEDEAWIVDIPVGFDNIQEGWFVQNVEYEVDLAIVEVPEQTP